ncbi:MAG: hypothetical protein IJ695_05485 [Butyrivibrio sp.]|nr:hypothetical protein [Butyrivibrio sp.]
MSVNEEIRQQQKKLEGKPFKEKAAYFWDYYKIHTIVVIFVIIMAITLIRDVANKKPYALYAIFINNMGAETQSVLQDGFYEYAGIDPKSETVLVDTASNYLSSSIDQTAVATSEKILALIAAKELDVMVTDENISYHYASQGTFSDLRDIFTDAELESFGDKVFYVDSAYAQFLASDEYSDYLTTGKYDTSNPYAVMAAKYNETLIYGRMDKSEMTDPVPVGIVLDASSALKECEAFPDAVPIACIVTGSQRPERAKEFLNYLFK